MITFWNENKAKTDRAFRSQSAVKPLHQDAV